MITIFSTIIDNFINKNINQFINKIINKNINLIEFFNRNNERIITKKNKKIKNQKKKHIKKIITIKNTTISIMNQSMSNLIYSTMTINFMMKHIIFSLLNKTFIIVVDVKRNFISIINFINICVIVQFNCRHRRNQTLSSTISMLSLFNLMLIRIII